MTLDPISIATYGYQCGDGPNDIAIALLGLVCFGARRAEAAGPAQRRQTVLRVPFPQAVQDDEELAIIAMAIAIVLLQ